mmetsp:Transcript_27279/g.33715  ORF Transcript_27279/g.33715 Transcript_27279/m.33715 type:complete len:153 (+) Transcript_27279:168-626(+)
MHALIIAILSFSQFVIASQKPRIPFIRRQKHEEPDSTLDFENFGFSLNGVDTDNMWLDDVKVGSTSFSKSDGCLVILQAFPLRPSSTVLNYGQVLFEGLKALFRRKDGSIVLFRPIENAKRLASGSRRLLLPEVPEDMFLDAVKSVVRSTCW